MSAFSNKACINFKDKAMQVFKFKDFMDEQERIEDVFLGMLYNIYIEYIYIIEYIEYSIYML